MMIQRCTNPKNDRFASYGGRGITVCERWRRSFDAFATDVGARPSRQHTIDRIDNTKGYEPGNVRWATAIQQQRNMRSNVQVTFRGETLLLVEWAERLKIKYTTLSLRLFRGWSVERALGEAVVPRRRTKKDLTKCL